MRAKVMLGVGLALALVTASGQASDLKQYRDWRIALVESGAVAAMTINDSGSIFSSMCWFASSACHYQVVFDLECEEGGRYGGLVNSDVGMVHVTLRCTGKVTDRRSYIYDVTEHEQIDEIVKKGTRMALAIGTEGGSFRVLRFSMLGAAAAITAQSKLISSYNAQDSRPARQGTRDLTL